MSATSQVPPRRSLRSPRRSSTRGTTPSPPSTTAGGSWARRSSATTPATASAPGIIQNAIPFAELKDPRVVTEDTHVQAEDRKSDFIQVNNGDRDDPLTPFSGI